MKNGWKQETLGEIGKVSMCKRILKKQTNNISGIPFYKIGTFGKEANAFISEEIYNEFKEKYSFPKKGDILLSASGTIGRRVIYDGEPAYFQDSNIVWIDNDEKKVLNEYLYKFYGFCDWNPSRGATISRLYNDDLRRIKVAFPIRLDEQKQIVETLDKAFEAIDKAKENIEKNIQNSKELYQSRLNEIFSQKGEDWEEKDLLEISKIMYGYTAKSKNSGNIKYLRITDIQDKNVNWESVPYCDLDEEEFLKYKLQRGDIVFARTGATTGKSFLIEDFPKSVFASYLIRVQLNEEHLLPNFLYLFFQSSYYWNEINQGISGSAQGGFNAKKLGALKISYPKEEKIQQNIIKELNIFYTQTKQLEEKYQQKLKNLEELKKSILQKAFSGELI